MKGLDCLLVPCIIELLLFCKAATYVYNGSTCLFCIFSVTVRWNDCDSLLLDWSDWVTAYERHTWGFQLASHPLSDSFKVLWKSVETFVKYYMMFNLYLTLSLPWLWNPLSPKGCCSKVIELSLGDNLFQ